MPRSRSRSIESRYWARMSRGSTAPQISSMRSASVDLPWSMWAMIERLRRRARSVTGRSVCQRPRCARHRSLEPDSPRAGRYPGPVLRRYRSVGRSADAPAFPRSNTRQAFLTWPTSRARSSATARTRRRRVRNKAVRSELKTRRRPPRRPPPRATRTPRARPLADASASTRPPPRASSTRTPAARRKSRLASRPHDRRRRGLTPRSRRRAALVPDRPRR